MAVVTYKQTNIVIGNKSIIIFKNSKHGLTTLKTQCPVLVWSNWNSHTLMVSL